MQTDTTTEKTDLKLVAHLVRRAGFGADRRRLERYAENGYEAAVDELLNAPDRSEMPDDLIRRYHHEQSGMMGQIAPGSNWLYKMASSADPLREKMALFWHGIFATGYPKITQGKVLSDQIRMFRRHGMGKFRDLLLRLAKDPAMIVWLDNHDNHKGAINENFGRELLELFSMGVGSYDEDDIKEASRAFTGWTIDNTEYMALRAMRDSIWPYGRIAWRFRFDESDHDGGEKAFLGERGEFDGDEIVDIICRQDATARFIARHMYHFFVADEPPVPQWPYVEPRDPEAIDALAAAYFESDGDISRMLRALFTSDFFKSRDCWYARVKSPAELVAGVLRLTGEFHRPKRQIIDRQLQMTWMGQFLINPPSVEGWTEGLSWIDTGALVERINFASEQMGNAEHPGIRSIIERVATDGGAALAPDALVDRCLDEIGMIEVSAETRGGLIAFAAKDGDLTANAELDAESERRVSELLQMIAATHEFQRA